MTIETEIAGLTQATTDLLDAVNVRKATLDEKVSNADAFAQASLTSANNAAASATAANTSKTAAETARTGAETARNAAVTAQNNAVAVVTGGTATLAPEAGKIPLADAMGKINALWVALTALVEQSDVGTGPNQVPLNQFLGGMAYQSHLSVYIEGGVIQGQIRRRAPVTKTAAFAVANDEHWLICNGTASITVTLPDAATNMGREIMLKTIAAFTVVSASSNVIPLAGGAAGTAILAATAGKYATLVSDGTNWIITQAN